ncbi:sensor histidine kinase [Paenibacillus agricola]|uniref:histidine kinase n=1 Tax=Paenibacillus agricola TaxID=2716264 RepID=A0ABX0J205_9BACL|nr:HAMP domain-containing sensor histidine kinase [Paenibacillus agricola]NHN30320.1 HAMP domain-containing histidine kinase [Paenibacillus agricola]
MMDNRDVLTHVRINRAAYITYWIQAFNERFPNRYDESYMYSMGEKGFGYITDLETAVEAYPLHNNLLGNCIPLEQLVEQEGVETGMLFLAAQLWRQTLLEVGESTLTLTLFKQMNARIDYFETVMCQNYWNQSISQMKDNASAITKHHDDRISLVGKMAASMAHEIRNPMTSIKGFLKLLRSTITSNNYERAEAYLDFIDDECDHILMQVTGFLSFSKKPIMDEAKDLISAKQVLDHILSLLNPRLINENVDLTLTISANLMLNVQKMAIQQVLSNLLNNGIDALSKLKSDKKIHIAVMEDNFHTYIRVSNNGPSIPSKMNDVIFNPFVTDKENGTGLGLAICKQIMLKNDGDISFTSNEKETSFLLAFRKNIDSD